MTNSKLQKIPGGKSSATFNQKNSAGFTLIEIIVVIFGFSLIAWGMIGLFSNIFYSSSQQTNLISDTDQSRKLAFQIASELRNGQTGSNGAYVLDTAGDQQIIFYSNIDTTPSVERIRYFISNGKLWKGVTYFSGGIYDTTKEQTIVVQNDLANGANPVFFYYDGNYNGTAGQPALSQPVNVTSVKYVRAAIQIYNLGGVTKQNIYTVTAGGAIRNLKTNLGS